MHLARAAGGLTLPTLERLGLGSIMGLEGVAPARAPVVHGRLCPQGPGKDSTSGHWELMGVIAPVPAPTYPAGFPPALIEALERATGRPLLCNRPYDGMAALEDFGAEHLRTGALIVYTSQDSVAQLAAHTDVLPEAELYAACVAARRVMTGEHAVARVIARPFRGPTGAFLRTDGRRDFSVTPPSRSHLDALREASVPTHAVGKTHDLFAGRGFDAAHPGATNAGALDETGRLVGELEHGLVYTNLVETDQVYGHRKDIEGFHAALKIIDTAVATWLERLGEGDLLILTADHGCDPLADHTDHTREHVPLLAAFPGHDGRRHDGALADVGASALAWLAGERDEALPGRSFVG